MLLHSQPVEVKLNHPFLQTSHWAPLTPSRHEHCPPYPSHTAPASAPTEPPHSHSVDDVEEVNHQISNSNCMSTHQRPVHRTQQRDWRQFPCTPLWFRQEPVSRGDKLPVDCFLHWLPSGHSRHSLTWSLAEEVAAKDEVKTDTRYTQTHIVTLKQLAT